MASKALRNIYTVLGLAEGVSNMIRDSYLDRRRNKTVLRLLDRVKHCSGLCFNAWKNEELGDDDILTINNDLSRLEGEILGRSQDTIVLCSFVMAIASDAWGRLKGRRKELVGELISAYMQLNRYFDRRLDKWDLYDIANEAVGKFNTGRR